MKEFKILLGATKDKEVVFANFEITTRNGYKEFAASFDIVSPRLITQDDIEAYYEDYAFNYGKEKAYDMCEWYDCKPSELSYYLAQNSYVYDIFDLMDEEIEVDDETWYLENVSCGQCDTKNDMKYYVNKEVYDLIYDLWTNYHLKEVGEEVEKQVQKIVDLSSEVDEMVWIETFIIEFM